MGGRGRCGGGDEGAEMSIADTGIVEIVRLLGAEHIRAEKSESELAAVRATLEIGLDRDRDNTSTPHLAAIAMNALASARQTNAREFADLASEIDALKAENARLRGSAP